MSLNNGHELEMYINDIGDDDLLTRDEEVSLAERIQTGDMDARNELIRRNLRLVINIAKKYLGKGMSLDDLVEEGNMGLIRASKLFDTTYETKFCTFATYLINQSIRRAIINTTRTIRLPLYMVELITKWKRIEKCLEAKGEPSDDRSIASKLEISEKKIGLVLRAIEVSRLSFNDHADPKEGNVPLDMLVDSQSDDPSSGAELEDEINLLLKRVDQLEERKRSVITRRFGLENGKVQTLREVGESNGLTRARVRQIQNETIDKLRSTM